MDDIVDKLTFHTSDIFLATFLKSIGYELLDAEKISGKIMFGFKDDDKRKQNVLDYYNKKIKVCPLSFSQNFKDLKGVLFNT